MTAGSNIRYECLPDYEFVHCLGRTPLGEVWKAQGPDGRLRAVKFIRGYDRNGNVALRDLDSARRLAEIRHPSLAEVERVEIEEGRLILVTGLAEETLRDRYDGYRHSAGAGIPRVDLLRYLRQAADGLDHLDQGHLLHHLGLNPKSLLLTEDRLLVADFGLIELLWIPAGQAIGHLNPNYAAPELFEERLSRASDQYSLALIYVEMLTGELPHRRGNSRQLITARLTEPPDLAVLPTADRELVAKALERDPRERFASCVEFIQALEQQRMPDSVAVQAPTVPSLELEQSPRGAGGPAIERAVAQLVETAAKASRIQMIEQRGLRFQIMPDGTLRHKCAAWLPVGVARAKLQGFIQRWNAQITRDETDRIVFQLNSARKLLGLFSSRKAIEIELQLKHRAGTKLSEVAVVMRYLGKPSEAPGILQQAAPLLLEKLHNHLLAAPEQRVQERFDFEQPVHIRGRHSGDPEPASGKCKDISFSGIGFYTQTEPALDSQVFITVDSEAGAFAIPAAVTRVQPTEDGWFEAGARFLLQPAEDAAPSPGA